MLLCFEKKYLPRNLIPVSFSIAMFPRAPKFDPSLFTQSLEEPAWRTKQGAVQLLAAMAFCAPKQLGSALPQIVPKLGEVLNDPHPKVQDAAKQALKEVGETIQSPEIKVRRDTVRRWWKGKHLVGIWRHGDLR